MFCRFCVASSDTLLVAEESRRFKKVVDEKGSSCRDQKTFARLRSDGGTDRPDSMIELDEND